MNVLPSLFGARDAQQPVLLAAGAGDNAAALGLGASSGDAMVSIGTSGAVFAVTYHPANDMSGTVAGFTDASGRFLPLTAPSTPPGTHLGRHRPGRRL